MKIIRVAFFSCTDIDKHYFNGKLMSRTISIDIKNKPKGKFSF